MSPVVKCWVTPILNARMKNMFFRNDNNETNILFGTYKDNLLFYGEAAAARFQLLPDDWCSSVYVVSFFIQTSYRGHR